MEHYGEWNGPSGRDAKQAASVNVNTINYWEKSSKGLNPFELPQSITKRLHEFARKFGGTTDRVKYLWVYITANGISAGGDTRPERTLGVEEWLNVVDEAASLGAEWLVVCVGASLAKHPEVWRICEWAQTGHDMYVGIHVVDEDLTSADLAALRNLDAERTHLLVSGEAYPRMKHLEEEGISVAVADVTAQDHTPPCDYPESMVCVGPGGNLYTCGLVLGSERFCLGSIMESDLKRVVDDNTLPHVVPQNVCWQEHGCDACPPFMVERLLSKQRERMREREHGKA
jgi:radical SAM protein with 4Fe4S-binding SPASM domain